MAHCYKGHPACCLFSYLFLAASFSCFFHPSMRACRRGGRGIRGSSRYVAQLLGHHPVPKPNQTRGRFLVSLAALVPYQQHRTSHCRQGTTPSRAPHQPFPKPAPMGCSPHPAPPPAEKPLHDLLQPPRGPPAPELTLLLGTSHPAHIHGTNPTRSTTSRQSFTIKEQSDLLQSREKFHCCLSPSQICFINIKT